MRWQNICSKCGYEVEADSPGNCPQCGATSWLCRLDSPVALSRRPLPESRNNGLTGEKTCNKIQGDIKHRAGRPRANIPVEKVTAMASEGVPLRAIGAGLGISHMTVKRMLDRKKHHLV